MNKTTDYKIGYARVSTHDQNLDLQMDHLKQAGCQKIFQDKVSGSKSHRVGLDQALDYLRHGDLLIVWRLDRLGRSLKDLIQLVGDLEKKGIGFCSLQEDIDTTTANGKLFFHIFGALAEFEQNIIRERTLAGLKAARARGRLGGRPKAMDEQKIKMAKALVADQSIPIKEICKKLGISKTTLYKYLKVE